MVPCLDVFCVTIQKLDTFQMVIETVFFHGTNFLLGRLLCASCVLFGDRTRNDSRVGRDLYRNRVFAPGDVTVVFSVQLAPFLTFTEFFSAQLCGVNPSR